MDYAVNVADRLNCRLLAAYVNTLPHLWDGGRRGRLFDSAFLESAFVFKRKAAAKGVDFAYVQESGRISKVINRLCHIVKRIEFVVIDRGIRMEEAVSRTPVPVFKVLYSDVLESKIGEQCGQDISLKRIRRP
jgi:hypothetical protein